MLDETYPDAESIPTGYQNLYTETEDGFKLRSGDEIKTVDDVASVQAALKKERLNAKTATANLKAFEGFDASTLQDSLDELEVLRTQVKPNADVDELVNQRLNAKTTPLQRQIEKLQKETEQYQEKINGYETAATRASIQATLREALDSANVRDDAKGELMANANFLFERDEDGNIVTKDGLSEIGVEVGMTPAQWIDSKREKSAYLWPDSKGAQSKGGTGGGSGRNPFVKGENYNLTEQSRLMREQPAKAAQLARQAGIEL